MNILEGLTEEEADQYFSDHMDIILLYEFNIAKLAETYQTEFSQKRAEFELERA